MFGDKLVLKQKMDRTWLIQRLLAPRQAANPFAFGGGLVNGGLSSDAVNLLKGIFSFDYMGSSEFEWGAVPAALSFLAEQSSRGNIVCGEIDSVYYLCPANYEEEVKDIIQKLKNSESKLFRLKEYCGLAEHFNYGDKNSFRNTLGWLELDNGFMFFVDEEMFENTKKLFGISSEEKKEDLLSLLIRCQKKIKLLLHITRDLRSQNVQRQTSLRRNLWFNKFGF